MIDLIEETKETLNWIHKKESDISWVGSYDGKYAMIWDDFKDKFKGINYDPGFGAQEIASDLVIAFKDGSWLERNEYDGSERWDYKKPPYFRGFNNFDKVDVHSIGDIGWDTLDELNGGTD